MTHFHKFRILGIYGKKANLGEISQDSDLAHLSDNGAKLKIFEVE